jgi:uncharacterized repeat protein (TIGR01451 family)
VLPGTLSHVADLVLLTHAARVAAWPDVTTIAGHPSGDLRLWRLRRCRRMFEVNPRGFPAGSTWSGPTCRGCLMARQFFSRRVTARTYARRALLVLAAGVLALSSGLAAPSRAATAVAQGPFVPTTTQPFPGMAWTPVGGDSGFAGGETWTYQDWDSTGYPYLAWGPADEDGTQLAFDGTVDSPGETMTFSPQASDLSAGRMRWLGSSQLWYMVSGDILTSQTFDTRFTVQVADHEGQPLPLVATIDLPAEGFMATLPPSVGDVGGVLVVDEITTDPVQFSANLLFEVDTDPTAGEDWAPALEFYNSFTHPAGAATESHFTAGFYHPLPGAGTVSPTLSFGDVEVGHPATLTATVTSTGYGPLYLTGSELAAGTDSAFSFGTAPPGSQPCHQSDILGPGDTCDIAVEFSPTSAGSASGTLVVHASDGDHSVALAGTGTRAVATFTPAIADGLRFGDVTLGGNRELPLTVTNTGTAGLNFSGPPTFSSGDYAISNLGPGCQVGEFAPGASCTVTVRFTPSVAGPSSATLTFTDDAADSPQVYPLRGTGVVPRADVGVSIGASPSSAQVKKPLTYVMRVQNNGPHEAVGVVLSNPLPPTATLTSLTVTSGTASCSAPAVGHTGTVVCQLGAVPAGGTPVTVEVVTQVVSGGGGTISDTATVWADTADPVTTNNAATVVTSVHGRK